MATEKITLILPQAKARNPHVVPSLRRKAGAHGKTRKAMRQHLRQRTQHLLADLLAGNKAEFDVA